MLIHPSVALRFLSLLLSTHVLQRAQSDQMNPTVYVKQLHLAALEKQQLLPALVEGIFKKNHNIQFEKQAFPETVLEILYIWRKNKGNPFLSSNVSIL